MTQVKLATVSVSVFYVAVQEAIDAIEWWMMDVEDIGEDWKTLTSELRMQGHPKFFFLAASRPLLRVSPLSISSSVRTRYQEYVAQIHKCCRNQRKYTDAL